MWKLVVPLALAASGAVAGTDDGMEGVPFTFGASVAEVQKALDISTPPQPLPRPSTALPEGDAVLRHAILGIPAFFRKSGHMYLIRFDPPFAGSIGGMKLGDSRAAVVQKLGNPARRLQGPYDRSEAYLYPISSSLMARFDFDATDNVERIMVFPAYGMHNIK